MEISRPTSAGTQIITITYILTGLRVFVAHAVAQRSKMPSVRREDALSQARCSD
jgi:hypothetical protein